MNNNTQDLLLKLTDAVCFKFKADLTHPSVIVSKVKYGYYVSIARYTKAFAKDKEVVCKATQPTLDEALKVVAKQFLAKEVPQKNPITDLNDALNGK